MNEPIQELELIVGESNALAIQDVEKQALIDMLKPIADAMPRAIEMARSITVENSVQAEQAALLMDSYTAHAFNAEQAIRKFGNGLLDRMYRTHRRGTALIGMFEPLKEASKTIKQEILRWQEAEIARAEAERAKLQAQADEKARKERERLEKLAEIRKTPETKERYREQAQQVLAPVVNVAPPERAVKSQKRLFITAINLPQFIDAAAKDKSLCGYIQLNTQALIRAKAANSMLNIPGITFERKAV